MRSVSLPALTTFSEARRCAVPRQILARAKRDLTNGPSGRLKSRPVAARAMAGAAHHLSSAIPLRGSAKRTNGTLILVPLPFIRRDKVLRTSSIIAAAFAQV